MQNEPLSIVFEKIKETIKETIPDIIYLGIGSALKWHPIETITSSNNQQHPPFLNKYKNKVIILFDNELEEPLYLESKMELTKVLFTTTNSKIKFRIFNNEDTIVFAINYNFYYSQSGVKHEDPDFLKIIGCEEQFLNWLIYYTLAYSSKLILNDYTGKNIDSNYVELLENYDKTSVLNNILYDVTQNDGGCIINFDKYPILYDNKDNFIQIKYLALSKIKEISSEHLKIMGLKRISFITYELTRMLRILNGEITEDPNVKFFTDSVTKIMNYISIIYNSVKKTELSKENINEAIFQILLDVCTSFEINMDFINYLQTNDYKQNIVFDSLNPIKYLISGIE